MKPKFKNSDQIAIALMVGLFLLNVIQPGYLKFFILTNAVARARTFAFATVSPKPKPKTNSPSVPLCDSDFARMVEKATKQGGCRL